MIRNGMPGLVKAALALLVTLVLATAGWAHRMPQAIDRAGAAALAAYVSVGGTADDLCASRPGRGDHADGCPVCRMPGLLPLPVRAENPVELPVSVIHSPACPGPGPVAACHPGWQGRAPPVV